MKKKSFDLAIKSFKIILTWKCDFYLKLSLTIFELYLFPLWTTFKGYGEINFNQIIFFLDSGDDVFFIKNDEPLNLVRFLMSQTWEQGLCLHYLSRTDDLFFLKQIKKRRRLLIIVLFDFLDTKHYIEWTFDAIIIFITWLGLTFTESIPIFILTYFNRAIIRFWKY